MTICFFNIIPMPHTLALQSELQENGYEVKFWYVKDKLAIYPWKESDSENLVYFVLKKKTDLFLLLKDCLKSDLIIISGWQTPYHIFTMLVCKLFWRKTAIWGDTPRKPKGGISRFLKKQYIKLSSYLFFTGNIAYEKLQEYYNFKIEKFQVFPYLNHLFEDKKVNEINNTRILSLKNAEKIRLLISNRFIERKGYQCIYEAFKQIQNEGKLSKFKITILGAGPEYDYYKKLFDELHASIELHNWVEYSDYLQYVKNTDIFLHASSWEPYGIPPMDAMACGKLVIASDGVMSCVDRIDNNENGYLFEANNVGHLKKILLDLCADTSLIYRIGQRAYDTSLKYTPTYNIDVIKALAL